MTLPWSEMVIDCPTPDCTKLAFAFARADEEVWRVQCASGHINAGKEARQ